MTTIGSATVQVTSVPGELHYLAPGSTVLRRFTAPGASVNTGRYESHTVPIRDGRPVQDTFRLDTHGFEIVAHRSTVTDFTDKSEVDARYAREVIEFVKEHTGADEVASLHYSPDHEWWYFPNMNRDEVLFFVFNDSDHSRAWRRRAHRLPGSDGRGGGASAQHRSAHVRVLPVSRAAPA